MERDLHVTSPMMAGPDVQALQERLAALGYTPGVPDGFYGPTTASAVRTFQRDAKLDEDGVVGPKTRAALATATGRPPPVASLTGQKALAEAQKYIGTVEQPAGSNRTEFGLWFGANGVAWCNIFVSYCFSVGADYILAKGFPGGRSHGIFAGKGCSYVPTTAAWLRSAGMWVGKSQPLPGDIVIYNLHGGRPDHIGIVSRVLGKDTFEAVEGNTSFQNDSNGGAVMLRSRHLTRVDGFGRITD